MIVMTGVPPPDTGANCVAQAAQRNHPLKPHKSRVCELSPSFSHLISASSFTADSFSRCNQEDGQCLLDAITATFRNFYKGVPEIGLVPLDPLRIDKMDIIQGDGPINIELNFRKVDLLGFREAKIKKAK